MRFLVSSSLHAKLSSVRFPPPLMSASHATGWVPYLERDLSARDRAKWRWQRHRIISFSTDYSASASDSQVLKQNPRTELLPEDITCVFGWPRDLDAKYHVGRVLGAGSFGVVRECIEKNSGIRFAVKTIPKTPKRGLSSPRYLLKLRTEVEIMEQLGFSLDAVCLKAYFEDDKSVHLVMELAEGGTLFERIEKSAYGERYIVSIIKSILRFNSQCRYTLG